MCRILGCRGACGRTRRARVVNWSAFGIDQRVPRKQKTNEVSQEESMPLMFGTMVAGLYKGNASPWHVLLCSNWKYACYQDIRNKPSCRLGQRSRATFPAPRLLLYQNQLKPVLIVINHISILLSPPLWELSSQPGSTFRYLRNVRSVVAVDHRHVGGHSQKDGTERSSRIGDCP